MKSFNFMKNTGFTLIEILLVVGFISLASIGSYIVYDKVQTASKANTEARNLDIIRAGVKVVYGGKSNYFGLTEKILLDARVIPDNMRSTDGNGIINSFGGVVTVRSNSLFGQDNIFTIIYPKVPVDVCSKFIATAASSFDHIQVNSGVVVKDKTGSHITAKGNQIDMSLVTAACNVTVGQGSSIEFTAY